jgi:hypothetical protein
MVAYKEREEQIEKKKKLFKLNLRLVTNQKKGRKIG